MWEVGACSALWFVQMKTSHALQSVHWGGQGKWRETGAHWWLTQEVPAHSPQHRSRWQKPFIRLTLVQDVFQSQAWSSQVLPRAAWKCSAPIGAWDREAPGGTMPDLLFGHVSFPWQDKVLVEKCFVQHKALKDILLHQLCHSCNHRWHVMMLTCSLHCHFHCDLQVWDLYLGNS